MFFINLKKNTLLETEIGGCKFKGWKGGGVREK